MDGTDQQENTNDGAADTHIIPSDRWDTDSALGSITDDGTSTASLRSEIVDYRHENGRRYHAYKEGTYHLPNDDDELNRLDLQHHLWRLTLDGALYLSPLSSSTSSVLDAGTGTGVWAIEFADEHPEATVLGTDLSPVQPTYVPPNCSFEVDDVESNWTFHRRFNFIHVRFLTVGMRDWSKFFRQAFQHLEPGGWVEVQEFILGCSPAPSTIRPNTVTTTWTTALRDAAAKVGIDVNAAACFDPLLEAAGFRNRKVRKPIWPVGAWPESRKAKRLGIWARQNLEDALGAISLAFLTRIEGWTKEDVEATLVGVRAELNDPEVHQYIQLYVCYAQKPEVDDS